MRRTPAVSAVLILFSLISASDAQQHLVPVRLAKISNDDGLTLGNGVSLERIHPAYESPFEKFTSSREGNLNPLASVHMYVVASKRALDAQTGVNVEAKARVLFASAESRAESDRASNISEESFRLVIVGESQYGHDELRQPKLKGAAAALIQQGRMKEFSQVYGTHFVLREHRIARIVLTISVDRWSANTVQKLRLALRGDASLPLAGGELKASIQSDLKEAADRKSLSVDVSTVGGSGLQGFGDVVKAILSNNPDFQTSVAEAVSGLLKGFTRDNSGIGAVTVASYAPYGLDASKLSLWNALFEDKLQKCAERYYAGRRVERSIRRGAIPNADPALKRKLEELAVKYDLYLAQLADFQKGLLNKESELI
jgi:hypothetical protein